MDSLLCEILIPGKPLPKKRPRLGRNNSVFDPQYKEKQYVRQLIDSKWREPVYLGPIELTIFFDLPHPKSWSKKRQANCANEPHTKKPDIDNLIKFYLDCMNGIVFKDDAQVLRIFASKQYCANVGSTLIQIEEVNV